MKLPNLRLYNTQASLGAIAGVAGVCFLALLAFCVLHGIDLEQMAIPYNPQEGTRGQYRPYIVNALTAFCVVVGCIAAILGFTSLGQKRNTNQRSSWLGLMLGAAVVAVSPLLWLLWRVLKESLI
ncbi:MAG: hypothetical protein ACE5F9_00190 [Phycisphaerae bacterium]